MLELDLYKILELNKRATEEQIRTQYKRLSLNFHPDKNVKEHAQYYGKYYNILSSVYKVLTTPESKQVYDVFGYRGIEECLQNSRFVEDYMDFWKFYNGGGRQEQERYRTRSSEDPRKREVNDILQEIYMKQKQKKEQEEEQNRQYRQQLYEEQLRYEEEQQKQWDKDYFFDQEQEEEKCETPKKKKGRRKEEREFDRSIDILDISKSTKNYIEIQKEKLKKQKKQKKIEIDRKEIQEKGELEYVEYIKEICRKCGGTNSKERRREYCECVKEDGRCNKCQNGFIRLKKSEVCEACTGGIAKNEQKIRVYLEKLIIK